MLMESFSKAQRLRDSGIKKINGGDGE